MDLTDKTILAIDDSPVFLGLLTKMLNKANVSILTAADGNEGCDLFREHQKNIDLVITDIVMPEKEGIATIQDILSISPFTKIVAVSSMNEEYLNWAIAMGATMALKKPLDKSSIEKILECLHGKKLSAK
jgi:YesN/AraC family two-component response regulator